MSAIDDLIANLNTGNTNNPTLSTNEAERDGNINDLLFATDQASLSVGVNASPNTLVQNAAAGTLTQKNIITLIIIAAVAWFLFKK